MPIYTEKALTSSKCDHYKNENRAPPPNFFIRLGKKRNFSPWKRATLSPNKSEQNIAKEQRLYWKLS